MRIAALQMDIGQEVAANKQMAADLVAQAAGAGAELMVLPEYWCLLGLRVCD